MATKKALPKPINPPVRLDRNIKGQSKTGAGNKGMYK
jgi:hypothetical protein